MSIEIEQMNMDNIKDIFNFEVENRFFFTKNLPPRPEEYFTFESFEGLMKEIIVEQSNHECSMYIIRDKTGNMIGRVNLTSIESGEIKKAEIGYRIGEKYQGNGYATEAVKLVTFLGFDSLKLSLIEAGTSTENLGSQRILERNGFKRVGKEERVMKINEKWVDGYLYVKDKTIAQ